MDFKDRLKAIRSAKGITITQLAAYLNKGESAVRMWEIGRSNPDLDTLIKLAEYFECSTDFLLGQSDTKNEKKRLEIDGLTQSSKDALNKFFEWLLVPYNEKIEEVGGQEILTKTFNAMILSDSFKYLLIWITKKILSFDYHTGSDHVMETPENFNEIYQEMEIYAEIKVQKHLQTMIGEIYDMLMES